MTDVRKRVAEIRGFWPWDIAPEELEPGVSHASDIAWLCDQLISALGESAAAREVAERCRNVFECNEGCPLCDGVLRHADRCPVAAYERTQGGE